MMCVSIDTRTERFRIGSITEYLRDQTCTMHQCPCPRIQVNVNAQRLRPKSVVTLQYQQLPTLSTHELYTK